MHGNQLLRVINARQPINWRSPLNNGLVSRYMAIPHCPGMTGWGSCTAGGGTASSYWKDLSRLTTGKNDLVTSFNGPVVWGRNSHPGGYGSVVYDGVTNSQTKVASNANLQLTGVLTIAAWIYPTNVGVTSPIAAKWDTTTNPEYRFVLISGVLNFSCGTTLVSSGVSVTLKAWTHVAVKFSDSLDTVWFYVNGLLVSTQTDTDALATNTNRWCVGNEKSAIASGSIDDVSLYNTLLNDETIYGLYNDSRLGYPTALNWIGRAQQMLSLLSIYSTVTEQNLPANHNGNITVHVVGVGTTFTSSTTWTPSGVAGWSVASKTQVDGTHYTIVLTPPAAATPPTGAIGTLSLTEGVTGTTVTTTSIGTPSLTPSPTSSPQGTIPTVTLSGANTLWSSETAAGLFTVSGGTGASFASPTVTTNTAATDALTVGSATATLTITDTSTGATCTLTVTADNLAAGTASLTSETSSSLIVACTAATGGAAGSITNQWYASQTANFTPGAGTLVSGATGLTPTISGLTSGVTYYLINVFTDTLGFTSQSNQIAGYVLNATVSIGCIGDSITFGQNSSAGNDPVTLMQSKLAHALGVRTVIASNQGVSGSTTGNWTSTAGGSNYAIAKAAFQALSRTPDYIQIMLGLNDARTHVATGTLSANLDTMIANIQADFPTAKIVLHYEIYVPSGANSGAYDQTSVGFQQNYQTTISSKVNGTTVLLGDIFNFPNFVDNRLVGSDNVHPSDAGYAVIADNWTADYVKKINPASGGANRAALPSGLSGLG